MFRWILQKLGLVGIFSIDRELLKDGKYHTIILYLADKKGVLYFEDVAVFKRKLTGKERRIFLELKEKENVTKNGKYKGGLNEI